jgi:hypothetical protein
MLIALVLAAVALTYAGSRFALSLSPPVVRASLPHRPRSYLGVYEDGSPPAYQPVADFATAVDKQPNLVGYFSGWAEPFATSFAERIHAHSATPFVQIDPTLASVSGIAAGDYDGYLSSYADSVRDYAHPVVIGFGHEMNSTAYSWGYGNVPPPVFIAAWRHIVTLFREQGAYNITWLWTIEADHLGTGPIADWWPGAKYVTWVGIDGYYYRPTDTFATVFAPTINQVHAFTRKPVLLSETAVGPQAGQIAKIRNLFTGMRQYDMLGLVWFDKDQDQGIYHQDWRIEGNVAAETAFKLHAADLTLARPR